MIKTNEYLIRGGELTAGQKANIVRQLLAARSSEQVKRGFYKGVRYSNNTDESGDVTGTYPAFYIPPYNGNKKYQTVVPMSPGTHILSANSYELEIIRLLRMFAPDNPDVKYMVEKTVKRLKTACFADKCVIGECFHSGLISLRFLIAVAPEEKEWVRKLVDKFRKHYGDQKRHGGVIKYFNLCMAEMDDGIVQPGL